MKKTKQIIAEDVLTIAKQIGFAPSDKQVEKILEMYDDAQADAPMILGISLLKIYFTQ